MAKQTPLDIYDDMPEDMKKYISNYGWHFNKKAYEYALSYMYKKNKKGDKERIKGFTKREVDELIENYTINIENKIMHDYVYVATMCKADFYGKSIEDDLHLILYVKDVVDDVDASDESVFRCWVAKMIASGNPIDWGEIC